MPLLSETPNRNTLNQRASRARKQEYITSLEGKIREYEQRGVHATSEVQNAARQVADENRMLKDELTVLREHVRCLEDALTRQGIVEILSDEGQVEGVKALGDGGSVVWQHAPSRTSRQPPVVPIHGSGTIATNSNSNDGIAPSQKRRQQQHIKRDLVLDVAAAADESNQYPSPPDEQVYKDLHDRKRRKMSFVSSTFDEQEAASILLSTATTPVTYEDSTSLSSYNNINHSDSWRPSQNAVIGMAQSEFPSQSYNAAYTAHSGSSGSGCDPRSHSRSSPNSTPCEEAALIIASMRGLAPIEGSESDIMHHDLGCDPSSNPSKPCKVDNVRLFGIMAGERS